MTQMVKVWDVPTRLFHWTLVILFGCMWYSGEQGGDWLQYHIWFGSCLASLLLFRLIWGVIGSQTARFSNFIKGPRNIVRYLRGELSENEQPGHNPLGGLMVLAMLLALLAQVSTGLFAADVDSYLYDGPLAKLLSGDMAEAATSFHKSFFNVILGLVGLHLLAIIAYRVFKKNNLVKAMITGNKAIAGDVPRLAFAPAIIALVALLVSSGGVYVLLTRL
ncbi:MULTISPECIES: cytochrome b/b6 domain-containing protein [unclassified Chromobacterium]|uniref:cytochrome b/b6 domain-containing protein n=1 Tax=unclassified Chromobacterium TaxID=2641838 RepID=UPI001F23A8EC|nr:MULTISPECIES: cytochrome b/b6 domain-containing protein [unclassified Chromobacterium]MCP1289903.1 cytochrome b/b6 domain-containing protein [Chromobacterium sp. S0633]UJB29781.1 hydrogenase [Chromobacterium sp. Beijing]